MEEKIISSEVPSLYFNPKEVIILRELLQFLNGNYARENFLRYGNKPSPDFNKGRLTPEEETAFWKKLDL
jgi:hypothetical protein